MGATGAVGGEALKDMLSLPSVERISSLGRREVDSIRSPQLQQHLVDVTDPESYQSFLLGHDAAVCTLGVGQPSKVSKEVFLRIDKDAVFDFASGCREAGITHFSLLASVGINAKSRSFYLRSKGELVEAIGKMGFERFSVFQPSMILTPENRYDWVQGVMLKVWPLLHPILAGDWKKYRGVKVEVLGAAIARNLLSPGKGEERLEWEDFQRLTN